MTRSFVSHFLNQANLLTLCGAISGLGCALASVSGQFSTAVLLLMAAGLCDLFDGFLARRSVRDDDQRAFGRQLDSLSDVCSFGFAPAVMLFSMGLQSLIEVAILGLLLISVIWRLAFFSIHSSSPMPETRSGFVGLPCTYVALVIPALFAVRALAPGLLSPAALSIALPIVTACLAIAMVSPWRVGKPGRGWYGVFVVLAIVIAAALLCGTPLTSLP